MNSQVKKAYRINQLQNNNSNVGWNCGDLPDVEVGDVCTIGHVWDGEGEEPENSYCYKVTDCGEDGKSDLDIYLNYEWMVLETADSYKDTKIKITNIDLI